MFSFWRSVQLRKKSSHFMIMVLSCCDLLCVVTNHPFLAFLAMSWLTEKISVYPIWVHIFSQYTTVVLGFSILALLVMNIDRYLATSHPIFHRTSVTKRRLLGLFAVLVMFEITLVALSLKDIVIPYKTGFLIFYVLIFPPMIFFNYKLFIVARESRKRNRVSTEIKRSFSLRNVSSCLLAVALFLLLSIPAIAYIGQNTKETFTLDNAGLVRIWGKTIASLNGTFNCLIFYWKNKILRTEGMKVIKSIKVSRRVESRFFQKMLEPPLKSTANTSVCS